MISNNSRFYKRFKEMVLDSLPHAAAEENNTVPAATGEFLVSVSGQVLKQKLALVQLGVEERGNWYMCFKLQILKKRGTLLR